MTLESESIVLEFDAPWDMYEMGKHITDSGTRYFKVLANNILCTVFYARGLNMQHNGVGSVSII